MHLFCVVLRLFIYFLVLFLGGGCLMLLYFLPFVTRVDVGRSWVCACFCTFLSVLLICALFSAL